MKRAITRSIRAPADKDGDDSAKDVAWRVHVVCKCARIAHVAKNNGKVQGHVVANVDASKVDDKQPSIGRQKDIGYPVHESVNREKGKGGELLVLTFASCKQWTRLSCPERVDAERPVDVLLPRSSSCCEESWAAKSNQPGQQ